VKTHKAKTPRCAVLDKAGINIRSGNCHTPYICRGDRDSGLGLQVICRSAVPIFAVFPLFHHEVFAIARNNRVRRRLAPVSASDSRQEVEHAGREQGEPSRRKLISQPNQ
jgi:hypothetical protein